MTLSHSIPSDKLFLLIGLTASVALHASLFLSRPSITTSHEFAIQPSDFSVEITLIETSAGQPEVVPDPILTTPTPTPESIPKTPPTAPLPNSLPTPTLAPRLTPTPPTPNLPPSTASSTILARPNPSQNSAPTYPDLARKKGWTGSVLLRAQISAQGTVDSLTLLKSSGHEILDQSATRAVRQWRFYPQEVGGTPTSSTVEIPVKFSLKH